MDVDFQSYRDVYRRCNHQGKFSVMDTKVKHEDFDRTVLNLHEGRYTMVDNKVTSKCLIKKFSKDQTKLRFYSLLRNIRHHSVLSLENFYDEHGQPRFVFSWADGSIHAWFKTEHAQKMLKSSLKGRCLSPRFREIIIDICSGLEHLFKEGIYPIKIGAKDIVMCQVGNQYFPKLLICEAKGPGTVNINDHKKKLWAEVKQTVKTLFNECGNTQTAVDPISLKFIDYIGKSSVQNLRNYPDTWSDLQKAKYLLMIMSADMNDARARVQNVGIFWPRTSIGNLPSPLHEMVALDRNRASPSNYNDKDPYDFLRICKDIIKHWLGLPPTVKRVCQSWEALVKKMDAWHPKIWCILYEIFGSVTTPKVLSSQIDHVFVRGNPTINVLFDSCIGYTNLGPFYSYLLCRYE